MVITIISTYIRLDPSETGGCKHKKHNNCYPCSLGLLCRNQMKRSWPKTWPCCKRHPEIPCYHWFVAVTLLVGWVPRGLWKSYKNADRISSYFIPDDPDINQPIYKSWLFSARWSDRVESAGLELRSATCEFGKSLQSLVRGLHDLASTIGCFTSTRCLLCNHL